MDQILKDIYYIKILLDENRRIVKETMTANFRYVDKEILEDDLWYYLWTYFGSRVSDIETMVRRCREHF